MGEEKEVGKVEGYFAKIGVAAIKVTAPFAVGDTLHIKGHTTDLEVKVESMQIDKQAVEKVSPGDDVGIKVPDRVRSNDTVYRK
jgi:putative protease